MLWLEEGHFCFLGCSAQSWNFEIHSGPEEKVPPPEAKLSSEPAEQRVQQPSPSRPGSWGTSEEGVLAPLGRGAGRMAEGATTYLGG